MAKSYHKTVISKKGDKNERYYHFFIDTVLSGAELSDRDFTVL